MVSGTNAPGGYIAVTPIGAVDANLCSAVVNEAENRFGLRCRVVSMLDSIEFAHNEQRDQYHSTSILDRLAMAAPDGAVKLVGITREDLFIPILTHVYGEAQLGGKACIVSTWRLSEMAYPSRHGSVLQARIVKEAIHELGHTFNLKHCPERSCIMHYCRRIEDVDHKSDAFCRYCQILLDDALKRIRVV